MYYLHRNILHTRIEEELSSLLENGENHRDVLTENFTDMTVKHIVLMEENGEREVIITNKTGANIGSSNQSLLEGEYKKLVSHLNKKQDEILVSDWRNSPYIVSVHPYKVNNNQSGYVLMFRSANSINRMVNKCDFFLLSSNDEYSINI